MEKTAKIYVAGHHGLVGSAIWNNLQQKGYTNLVGRSHKELDLLDGQAVKEFFDEEQPQYVILAAAHVGGIMANSLYRADFIYQNLQIQQNVIGESFRHDVKKLLFLGSTCIYPRDAGQPMKEEVLLTSPLEYTNEPYAIAKIAGLKMCESFNLQYGTNYIAVMPTNLYGPNDNFHLENSHVLPAMIRKIHLGKCLNEGDWDAVRKDMNLRPVEGVSGLNTDEEILAVLKKYGISGQEVTYGVQASRCVNSYGVRKWPMPVSISWSMWTLRIHTHPVPRISVTAISISVREKKSPSLNWRIRLSKKWAIRAN